MKKVMCLVLALALLCSLCACGKKETEEPQKENIATAEKQPEKETEKATEAATEAEEELVKFRLPKAEVYCKIPADYERLTNGSVAMTNGRDEFFASICCGDEGSYTGSTKDIFDALQEDYTNDVNKYLSPNADGQAWSLNYTDGASISGYEATKLTGTVGNTEGGTYQVYGYATIIEDRPVIFMGILCSEDQAQADMDTMTALVEQMAGSIYKK